MSKSKNEIFEERRKKHDAFEEKAMDYIRPYTTRRHLPDRWVSFNDVICAWDAKTSIFVEDSSHDEYFRLQQEDGIPVFIVYHDKHNNRVLVNWINELKWEGPKPPTKRSTSGDDYYVIGGGIPIDKFLEKATRRAKRQATRKRRRG